MSNRDQIDDLKWVIDQQKRDYREIQTQIRRYLFFTASTAVAAGISTYQFLGSYFSTEKLAKSLAQEGLFWQLSVFPPEFASAFVISFRRLSTLFLPVGFALIFIGMVNAFRTAQTRRCKPIGEGDLVSKGQTWKMEDWIEFNGQILNNLEEVRRFILQIASIGAKLIVLFIIVLILSSFSIILSFVMILYSYFVFWYHIHNTEILYNSQLRKPLVVIAILPWPNSLILFLENIPGVLPSEIRIGAVFLSILIVSLYLRRDIKRLFI